MLTVYHLSVLAMLAATTKWLTLTGQEVNASKSLAFAAAHSARRPPTTLEATLDGVRIPTQQEFGQLGVGVRTVPRRGTGPLLHKRIKEGKAALRKTRTIPGGFDRKATVAAVMIVAARLLAAELADVAPRDVSSLESAIMTAIWGPSRPCRAKEVVFALLLPGHRVAPSMVVPYKRMCWLAHSAPRARPKLSHKQSGSKRRSPKARAHSVGHCENSGASAGAPCGGGGVGPCREPGSRCTWCTHPRSMWSTYSESP